MSPGAPPQQTQQAIVWRTQTQTNIMFHWILFAPGMNNPVDLMCVTVELVKLVDCAAHTIELPVCWLEHTMSDLI